jgi:ABC-2 type transport system ATP-binding protein
VVTIKTEDNDKALSLLKHNYNLQPDRENGTIRFTVPHGEEFLPGFVSGFPVRLISIGLHRPTLEDVFLKLTGRAIREQEVNQMQNLKRRMRMRGH